MKQEFKEGTEGPGSKSMGKARPKKHEARGLMKKALVKLYLSSPAKVQFALAKFGMKHVLSKKKASFQEILKH